MLRKKGMGAIVFTMLLGCFCAIGGCAPQQAEPMPVTGGDDGELSVAVEWSMDGDCTTCHSTEAESATDAGCLVSIHEAQGLACVTCHADDQELALVHEGATADAKMPKKLKRSTVSSDTCLAGCHSQEELKARTEEVAVLEDAYGKVVNPHDMPVSDSHASVTCTDCHAMHKKETADVTAPQACLDCHHAGVYECGTCHEL